MNKYEWHPETEQHPWDVISERNAEILELRNKLEKAENRLSRCKEALERIANQNEGIANSISKDHLALKLIAREVLGRIFND